MKDIRAVFVELTEPIPSDDNQKWLFLHRCQGEDMEPEPVMRVGIDQEYLLPENRSWLKLFILSLLYALRFMPKLTDDTREIE